ncbi:MAG: hypothetical protein RR706_08470 [Muribaculaceae bacterium]
MIIKGFPIEVIKYSREFEKLLFFEKEYIKDLQNYTKCKFCSGELFNLLVFSEKTENFETFGDILKACINCEYSEVLKKDVCDNILDTLLEKYADSEQYNSECYSLEIAQHLDNYIHSPVLIHAIGRSGVKYDPHIEDHIIVTNILWKNNFLVDRLENIIDRDFNVGYDNKFDIN